MTGQSPIEIVPSDVVYEAQMRPVRFEYRATSFTLINTGSPDRTATVRAVPTDHCDVSVGTSRYGLTEMHWHTPAEHVVGERAPMEMHLVHHDAEGSPLVVAFVIVIGSPNLELDRILNRLPASGETGKVADIELARLVGAMGDSYRYLGSLTTPPFDEGVSWIVGAHPLTASRRQIDLFGHLFPEGNARELQPANGRHIQTDAPPRLKVRA